MSLKMFDEVAFYDVQVSCHYVAEYSYYRGVIIGFTVFMFTVGIFWVVGGGIDRYLYRRAQRKNIKRRK